MVVELELVGGDAYVGFASPPDADQEWRSERPMSAEDLGSELRRIGVHPLEIQEAIWAANKHFSNGTQSEVRRLREIRRRAERNNITEDDLQSVYDGLLSDSPIDKRAYLAVLSLTGHDPKSESAILSFLNDSRDESAVKVALGLLARWSDETFARAAAPFIDGLAWDKRGEVRSATMVYAGSLLRRGKATSLLERLIAIANDSSAEPGAVSAARLAIVDAAGVEVPSVAERILRGEINDFGHYIVRARENARLRDG